MSEGSMDEYYEKAKYLDSIFNINTGNNPHTGYGNYDKGKHFIERMEQPFGKAIEEGLLIGNEAEEAESIYFDFTDPYETEDKIKIIGDKVDEEIVNCKNDYLQGNDATSLCHYRYYSNKTIRETEKKLCYINSKVLVFENKISNIYYKQYFKDVIMNYLIQVIPSTTILILKGLD
jgi:hypothetical protein